MQGKVEICGINTAKLEVLKNDEMTELLRRTKEGDMAAREKLIRGNLRLVLSVLQRFASRGENMDDLFQVGCIGLIKAVDNFDINQPVRFSTYGVPMIVGEIRRYLRDNSAIRVSRSLRDTAYKVLQARERLLRQSQREPTVEQLAQELAIPREEVVLAMDAIVDPVSLYEPIYSEGGDTVCVMDQVSDRRCTDESWIQRIALKDAISRLTPRERSILMMRFNQGKTQMEVSAQIGISQAAHLGLGYADLRHQEGAVAHTVSPALPGSPSAAGISKGPAACTLQTASPFGCLNDIMLFCGACGETYPARR